MQKELSEAFPFFEKKQQFQNAMGQPNPQQPPQQQPQQIGIPPLYGQFNNQASTRPSSNFNQPPPPPPPAYGNANAYQQAGNNAYQNSPNNQFQNLPNPFGSNPAYQNNVIPQGNQVNYEFQQVQSRLKTELEATLKALLDEYAEEKKSSDQIYVFKQKLDENEATVNQLEEELKGKISSIQQQIASLHEFISQNDQVSVNKDNVCNYIKESNAIQTQILELSSEQDSIKESILYSEEAFKEKRIDFEALIKSVQQFSEQEFNTKLLLKKCVAAQNKK